MLGVALVLLYFGLAIAAAAVLLQQDRYIVTRTARIDAQARNLFEKVADSRPWAEWGDAAIIESQPDERIVARLASARTESFVTVVARARRRRDCRAATALSTRWRICLRAGRRRSGQK